MDINILISILAVVVGFCALCLSLCALGVSIWQGFETRKNYRLSVTPHVSIDFHFSGDGEISGLILSNNGIGPAIIKGITIHQSDQEFDYLLHPSKFINSILIGNNPNCSFKFYTLFSGYHIPAGEKKPIIYLKNGTKKEIDELFGLLFGISVSVNYTSIYGKSFYGRNTFELPS